VESNSFELPQHVVAKIEKVLGVSHSELNGYDLVKLIDELCDTALMFDQEERKSAHTQQRERRTHYTSES
jgi:hypothetical protein